MNKLIAVILGLAFMTSAACDDKGGMGCGGGDGSQYCGPNTTWTGSECKSTVKKKSI